MGAANRQINSKLNPKSETAHGIEYLDSSQREKLYVNLLLAVMCTVVVGGSGQLTITPKHLRAASAKILSVESAPGGGLTLRVTRRRENH